MNRLKNLPEAIIRNWPEKVICLTVALFLFLFYRISTLETKTFSVPLQIENTGTLTPSVPYLKTVRISLRGERDKIYSIAEEDVAPYLDISSAAEEGETTLPVRLRLSGTAAAIEPLEITIDPPEITVMLERKMTKSLPISCVLTGFPEEGYALENCALNPSSIAVSGPRSLVEGLEELKTEPVSLEGLNSNLDGTASVILPGELFSLEGSALVSYRLSIAPEISERSFEGVRVVFGPLIYGLEMESAPVTGSLVIRGPSPALSRWTPPSTLLSVLCSEITEPGTYTLDVRVNIPQDFSVVSLEPQTVTVSVRERGDD